MKRIFLLLGIISMLIIACSEDAITNLEEENTEATTDQSVDTLITEDDDSESSTTTEESEEEEGPFTNSEAVSILAIDTMTSIIDNALSLLYQNNNTTNKSDEPCYSAQYFESGFIATFNECVFNNSEIVSGSINVSYITNSEESGYTATFNDFFIGTTEVVGTRTFLLTLEEGAMVSLEVSSNINLNFEDGSTISESGTKVFSLDIQEGQDSVWNLQGNWTVQKDGNTYTIAANISKEISCEYWSFGAMNVGVHQLVVNIDFGSGTCDNIALITYPDGTTQNVTL